MSWLADRVFDVAIIGGGVQGLAIARDCAMRRLSVALFEREDFGSASSASASGLLSGQPEWLSADRKHTALATQESLVLSRIAPNLVRRFPLVVPFPRLTNANEALARDAEAHAYDRFLKVRGSEPHRRLLPSELRALVPTLSKEIPEAIVFEEIAVDTARFVFVLAKSAASAGAQLFAHTDITQIQVQKQGVVGVWAKPRGASATLVRARSVVQATGTSPSLLSLRVAEAATSRIEHRLHLSFETSLAPFGIKVVDEGATYLAIPNRRDSTLSVGGIRGDAPISPDTVRRHWSLFSRILPSATSGRLHSIKIGARLTFAGGKSEHLLGQILDQSQHRVHGLYTVAGGPFALSRLLAEEVTDRICHFLRQAEACRTHLESFTGCTSDLPWDAESRRTGLHPGAVAGLMHRHGFRALGILEKAQREPDSALVICPCRSILAAEIEYCVREEWATDLVGVSRRTGLGMGRCQSAGCGRRAALVLQRLLHLSNEETESQEQALRAQFTLPPDLCIGDAARQAEYGEWL